MRFPWPFVLRSTYEETINALAWRDRDRAEAYRAREAAETHARNMADEVKVARDALDRILSWKASQ